MTSWNDVENAGDQAVGNVENFVSGQIGNIAGATADLARQGAHAAGNAAHDTFIAPIENKVEQGIAAATAPIKKVTGFFENLLESITHWLGGIFEWIGLKTGWSWIQSIGNWLESAGEEVLKEQKVINAGDTINADITIPPGAIPTADIIVPAGAIQAGTTLNAPVTLKAGEAVKEKITLLAGTKAASQIRLPVGSFASLPADTLTTAAPAAASPAPAATPAAPAPAGAAPAATTLPAPAVIPIPLPLQKQKTELETKISAEQQKIDAIKRQIAERDKASPATGAPAANPNLGKDLEKAEAELAATQTEATALDAQIKAATTPPAAAPAAPASAAPTGADPAIAPADLENEAAKRKAEADDKETTRLQAQKKYDEAKKIYDEKHKADPAGAKTDVGGADPKLAMATDTSSSAGRAALAAVVKTEDKELAELNQAKTALEKAQQEATAAKAKAEEVAAAAQAEKDRKAKEQEEKARKERLGEDALEKAQSAATVVDNMAKAAEEAEKQADQFREGAKNARDAAIRAHDNAKTVTDPAAKPILYDTWHRMGLVASNLAVGDPLNPGADNAAKEAAAAAAALETARAKAKEADEAATEAEKKSAAAKEAADKTPLQPELPWTLKKQEMDEAAANAGNARAAANKAKKTLKKAENLLTNTASAAAKAKEYSDEANAGEKPTWPYTWGSAIGHGLTVSKQHVVEHPRFYLGGAGIILALNKIPGIKNVTWQVEKWGTSPVWWPTKVAAKGIGKGASAVWRAIRTSAWDKQAKELEDAIKGMTSRSDERREKQAQLDKLREQIDGEDRNTPEAVKAKDQKSAVEKFFKKGVKNPEFTGDKILTSLKKGEILGERPSQLDYARTPITEEAMKKVGVTYSRSWQGAERTTNLGRVRAIYTSALSELKEGYDVPQSSQQDIALEIASGVDSGLTEAEIKQSAVDSMAFVKRRMGLSYDGITDDTVDNLFIKNLVNNFNYEKPPGLGTRINNRWKRFWATSPKILPTGDPMDLGLKRAQAIIDAMPPSTSLKAKRAVVKKEACRIINRLNQLLEDEKLTPLAREQRAAALMELANGRYKMNHPELFLPILKKIAEVLPDVESALPPEEHARILFDRDIGGLINDQNLFRNGQARFIRDDQYSLRQVELTALSAGKYSFEALQKTLKELPAALTKPDANKQTSVPEAEALRAMLMRSFEAQRRGQANWQEALRAEVREAAEAKFFTKALADAGVDASKMPEANQNILRREIHERLAAKPDWNPESEPLSEHVEGKLSDIIRLTAVNPDALLVTQIADNVYARPLAQQDVRGRLVQKTVAEVMAFADQTWSDDEEARQFPEARQQIAERLSTGYMTIRGALSIYNAEAAKLGLTAVPDDRKFEIIDKIRQTLASGGDVNGLSTFGKYGNLTFTNAIRESAGTLPKLSGTVKNILRAEGYTPEQIAFGADVYNEALAKEVYPEISPEAALEVARAIITSPVLTAHNTLVEGARGLISHAAVLAPGSYYELSDAAKKNVETDIENRIRTDGTTTHEPDLLKLQPAFDLYNEGLILARERWGNISLSGADEARALREVVALQRTTSGPGGVDAVRVRDAIERNSSNVAQIKNKLTATLNKTLEGLRIDSWTPEQREAMLLEIRRVQLQHGEGDHYGPDGNRSFPDEILTRTSITLPESVTSILTREMADVPPLNIIGQFTSDDHTRFDSADDARKLQIIDEKKTALLEAATRTFNETLAREGYPRVRPEVALRIMRNLIINPAYATPALDGSPSPLVASIRSARLTAAEVAGLYHQLSDEAKAIVAKDAKSWMRDGVRLTRPDGTSEITIREPNLQSIENQTYKLFNEQLVLLRESGVDINLPVAGQVRVLQQMIASGVTDPAEVRTLIATEHARPGMGEVLRGRMSGLAARAMSTPAGRGVLAARDWIIERVPGADALLLNPYTQTAYRPSPTDTLGSPGNGAPGTGGPDNGGTSPRPPGTPPSSPQGGAAAPGRAAANVPRPAKPAFVRSGLFGLGSLNLSDDVKTQLLERIKAANPLLNDAQVRARTKSALAIFSEAVKRSEQKPLKGLSSDAALDIITDISPPASGEFLRTVQDTQQKISSAILAPKPVPAAGSAAKSPLSGQYEVAPFVEGYTNRGYGSYLNSDLARNLGTLPYVMPSNRSEGKPALGIMVHIKGDAAVISVGTAYGDAAAFLSQGNFPQQMPQSLRDILRRNISHRDGTIDMGSSDRGSPEFASGILIDCKPEEAKKIARYLSERLAQEHGITFRQSKGDAENPISYVADLDPAQHLGGLQQAAANWCNPQSVKSPVTVPPVTMAEEQILGMVESVTGLGIPVDAHQYWPAQAQSYAPSQNTPPDAAAEAFIRRADIAVTAKNDKKFIDHLLENVGDSRRVIRRTLEAMAAGDAPTQRAFRSLEPKDVKELASTVAATETDITILGQNLAARGIKNAEAASALRAEFGPDYVDAVRRLPRASAGSTSDDPVAGEVQPSVQKSPESDTATPMSGADAVKTQPVTPASPTPSATADASAVAPIAPQSGATGSPSGAPAIVVPPGSAGEVQTAPAQIGNKVQSTAPDSPKPAEPAESGKGRAGGGRAGLSGEHQRTSGTENGGIFDDSGNVGVADPFDVSNSGRGANRSFGGGGARLNEAFPNKSTAPALAAAPEGTSLAAPAPHTPTPPAVDAVSVTLALPAEAAGAVTITPHLNTDIRVSSTVSDPAPVAVQPSVQRVQPDAETAKPVEVPVENAHATAPVAPVAVPADIVGAVVISPLQQAGESHLVLPPSALQSQQPSVISPLPQPLERPVTSQPPVPIDLRPVPAPAPTAVADRQGASSAGMEGAFLAQSTKGLVDWWNQAHRPDQQNRTDHIDGNLINLVFAGTSASGVAQKAPAVARFLGANPAFKITALEESTTLEGVGKFSGPLMVIASADQLIHLGDLHDGRSRAVVTGQALFNGALGVHGTMKTIKGLRLAARGAQALKAGEAATEGTELASVVAEGGAAEAESSLPIVGWAMLAIDWVGGKVVLYTLKDRDQWTVGNFLTYTESGALIENYEEQKQLEKIGREFDRSLHDSRLSFRYDPKTMQGAQAVPADYVQLGWAVRTIMGSKQDRRWYAQGDGFAPYAPAGADGLSHVEFTYIPSQELKTRITQAQARAREIKDGLNNKLSSEQNEKIWAEFKQELLQTDARYADLQRQLDTATNKRGRQTQHWLELHETLTAELELAKQTYLTDLQSDMDSYTSILGNDQGKGELDRREHDGFDRVTQQNIHNFSGYVEREEHFNSIPALYSAWVAKNASKAPYYTQDMGTDLQKMAILTHRLQLGELGADVPLTAPDASGKEVPVMLADASGKQIPLLVKETGRDADIIARKLLQPQIIEIVSWLKEGVAPDEIKRRLKELCKRNQELADALHLDPAAAGSLITEPKQLSRLLAQTDCGKSVFVTDDFDVLSCEAVASASGKTLPATLTIGKAEKATAANIPEWVYRYKTERDHNLDNCYVMDVTVNGQLKHVVWDTIEVPVDPQDPSKGKQTRTEIIGYYNDGQPPERGPYTLSEGMLSDKEDKTAALEFLRPVMLYTRDIGYSSNLHRQGLASNPMLALVGQTVSNTSYSMATQSSTIGDVKSVEFPFDKYKGVKGLYEMTFHTCCDTDKLGHQGKSETFHMIWQEKALPGQPESDFPALLAFYRDGEEEWSLPADWDRSKKHIRLPNLASNPCPSQQDLQNFFDQCMNDIDSHRMNVSTAAPVLNPAPTAFDKAVDEAWNDYLSGLSMQLRAAKLSDASVTDPGRIPNSLTNLVAERVTPMMVEMRRVEAVFGPLVDEKGQPLKGWNDPRAIDLDDRYTLYQKLVEAKLPPLLAQNTTMRDSLQKNGIPLPYATDQMCNAVKLLNDFQNHLKAFNKQYANTKYADMKRDAQLEYMEKFKSIKLEGMKANSLISEVAMAENIRLTNAMKKVQNPDKAKAQAGMQPTTSTTLPYQDQARAVAAGIAMVKTGPLNLLEEFQKFITALGDAKPFHQKDSTLAPLPLISIAGSSGAGSSNGATTRDKLNQTQAPMA